MASTSADDAEKAARQAEWDGAKARAVTQLKQLQSEKMALAQEAEAIIGMPLSVLDFEKLGFAVRACGLETQVKAQALVELLLKATRNDQLWIGRGC